jgi:hypothetical protein
MVGKSEAPMAALVNLPIKVRREGSLASGMCKHLLRLKLGKPVHVACIYFQIPMIWVLKR